MSANAFGAVEVVIHEHCPSCGVVTPPYRKSVPSRAFEHVLKTAGKDFWTDADSEGGDHHWQREQVCGECAELDGFYRMMK